MRRGNFEMRKLLSLVLGLSLYGLVMAQPSTDSIFKAGKEAYLRGEYPAAIELYQGVYKQATKQKDHRLSGEALRLIGDAFRATNEMPEAKRQLRKAMDEARMAKDDALTCKIHDRLAAVYFETQDYQLCRYHANEAIALAEKLRSDADMSSALNILGAVNRQEGRYKEAMEALEKAVELNAASGDSTDVPSILNNMANTFMEMKKYDKAIETATRSYEMAKRLKIPVYMSYAAYILTQVYRAEKDWRLALEWKDISVDIDRGIMNDNKAKELNKLKNELDYARQQQELESLQQEARLKDQIIARRSAQTVAFTGIMILVVVIAALFIYMNFRARAANKILRTQNDQIEQQSSEISQINTNLARVGEELLERKRRLEEINKVKDKLFSIISHDLRSPLNSIQGMLDLLKSGRLPAEDFAKMSDTLMSRVENTTMLLDNLLNWSRSQMEGFNANPQPLDLGDLADRVVNQLDQNARAKDIKLENKISFEAKAVGDRDMVTLVFRNLISNAIKFTPKGGHIQVIDGKDNGQLRISVIDDGKGIAPEDMPKVLGEEYFFTLGTANERGSGLGLRLCREFLQKNQGVLGFEPNPEKGTTFWFTLPAA